MNRHPTTRCVAGVPPALPNPSGLPYKLCCAAETAAPRPATRAAFTLIELLVVVSVIALVLAIVIPSISTIFTAGSDQQSRNLLGAQLSAARGMAIENQSYALLHVQIGTDGKCWLMPLRRNPDPNPSSPRYFRFIEDAGYQAQALPGGMALGEVTSGWVDPNGSFNDAQSGNAGDAPDANFTTLNVIFGPDGSLVTQVPDAAGVWGNPVIDTGANPAFTGSGRIWDPPVTVKPGVRTLALFETKVLKALGPGTGAGSRADYLNRSASFVSVNSYSGQLLPTR